jgi:hypothetical protein
MPLRAPRKLDVKVFQHTSDGIEEHRLDMFQQDFDMLHEALKNDDKVVACEDCDGATWVFRSSSVVRVVARMP